MAASRKRAWVPLVSIVVLAAGFLTLVLVKGWSPALGLDLQGGASVVYQAENEVPDEALDDTIEIIRSRVDALGVAEPEILRQGDSIVVNLPGIDDRDRALQVIGRTAELRFRPVLSEQPFITQEQLDAADSSTTTVPGETTTTVPGETTTTLPGETTTTVAEAPTTTEGAAGLPSGLADGEYAAALPGQEPDPSTSTTSTIPPVDAGTTTIPGSTTTTVPAEDAPHDGCLLLGGTTPTEADTAEATVVLPSAVDADEDGQPDSCFQLGPVPTDGDRSLLGSIVSGPEAQINQGQWGVALDIKSGDLPLFNRVASECFSSLPSCPANRLAIALDGEVQSAPTIREPSFGGEGLTISGSFTEREARDLALVLRFGALPVELEAQTVQTVSATLGDDSLKAGLIAGFLGVALVAIYMLLYYRALGVVVLMGLSVWSAINFAIISWLGETQDLALSLSGVIGIVISVGVTVDSYVVYFERLKDEVRSGKTLRSSVDRGFQRAFRTILAADVSSFIGAALLYTLTVGPVRGFAFFLGLSTLLDVLVAYFFTRPLVSQLGRSSFFTSNRTFGVGRGLGMAGPATAGGTG